MKIVIRIRCKMKFDGNFRWKELIFYSSSISSKVKINTDIKIEFLKVKVLVK